MDADLELTSELEHEPFNHVWTKPAEGFEWVKNRQDSDWCLVERETTKPRTTYNPLDLTHSGLFRTFAEVKPTRDGILKFANEYGKLGANNQGLVEAGRQGEARLGEHLSTWQHEITTMAALSELREQVRRKDSASLAGNITWSKDQKTVYWKLKGIGAGTVSASWLNPQLLEHFQASPILLPAKYILQKLTNEEIARHRVYPTLLWAEDTLGNGRDGKKRNLRVFIRPRGLIDALWLQFLFAVATNSEVRSCARPTCGKWFPVGAGRRGSKRITAIYHDEICKALDAKERENARKAQQVKPRKRAKGA